ncbi:MAG: DUF6134 family protein [Cyclobacteriaceae bacterium]
MSKLSSILIILFFTASSASGQILKYEVVKGSKKLGDMVVERKAYNDEVSYNVESKVVFRLLFSFTVDFESSALYKNNILERESTTSKLNGSTQKSSDIVRKGDNYSLTSGGVSSTEKGPITYSIASIYHHEPENGQQVFSPQFGQYLTFERIGEHKYEMESPDGINEYTYMNGICTEVKVSRDFAKFYFKMSPETYYAVKNMEDSVMGGN